MRDGQLAVATHETCTAQAEAQRADTERKAAAMTQPDPGPGPYPRPLTELAVCVLLLTAIGVVSTLSLVSIPAALGLTVLVGQSVITAGISKLITGSPPP